MPKISLCFRLELPKPFYRTTFFDIGKGKPKINQEAYNSSLTSLAKESIIPTNELLLELIEKYEGRFRVSFAISGSVYEGLGKNVPSAIDSFTKLSETGSVEFLANPYVNTRAFMFDRSEFERQLSLQKKALGPLLPKKPHTMCPPSLIYHNHMAYFAQSKGYSVLFIPGHGLELNKMYKAPWVDNLKLFPQSDFGLSSQPKSNVFPKHANIFSKEIATKYPHNSPIGFLVDYDLIGTRYSLSSGVNDFFKYLPEEFLSHQNCSFVLPRELGDEQAEELDYSHFVGESNNFFKINRDDFHKELFHHVFRLTDKILETGDEVTINDWMAIQEIGVNKEGKLPFDQYKACMLRLADFEARLK